VSGTALAAGIASQSQRFSRRLAPCRSQLWGFQADTLAVRLILIVLLALLYSKAALADVAPSFRNEVIPVLTKHGCATGACHGSPSGKGGFRLSLRGFDPVLDELTLIREEFGRRTNPSQPETSLLLRKPLMEVAHGGGMRLRVEDPAYRILSNWIAAGCRPDGDDVASCVGIQVQVATSDLKTQTAAKSVTLNWPRHEESLRVIGEFSDGERRDITHLADFSSSHEDIATVAADGRVTCHERGEATVLVRYLDRVATVDFTLMRDVDGFEWPEMTSQDLIDEIAFSKLKRLQIAPSEVTSDSEFLRRVYLDTIGVLPTVDEARTFLDGWHVPEPPAKGVPESSESADAREPRPSPGALGRATQNVGRNVGRATQTLGRATRRSQLIDDLLARQEYAEFQSLQWADLLKVKTSKLGEAGVHKFNQWLVRAVRDNKPFDEFVRELLTATGSTFDNPPAAFFRATSDPNGLSETTSQLFLGIRIQCARCHNHPFERWTQDHYYGMGAFFSRVRLRDGAAPDEKIVWLAGDGEVTHLRTQQPASLVVPITGKLEVATGQDRRVAFAEWLTSESNPFFAKMTVNRLWARFLGRGIVEPVDDFRDSNPPAHPELLDRLAAEFVNSGYDTRHIVRLILNSQLYQLSSRTNTFNESDERYFSHGYARLLRAEQLLEAISQVTAVPERFNGLPPGTRATALPSPDVGSDFLKTFGQSARNTACDCERNSEPKLTHALSLISGEVLSTKLGRSTSRLSNLLNNLDGRLARAGQPPQDGLRLWLRADSGVLGSDGGPVIDGLPVSRWLDRSSARLDVEQAEDGSRPQFVAFGLGSLPTLRFDGQNDFLRNVSNNLVESGAARTVLIVGRAGDRGGSMLTFRRSRAAAGGVFTVQEGLYSGTFYVYSDGVNAGGNSSLPSSPLDTVQQPFVTTFVSRGKGEKLEVRINGEPQKISQTGAVGPDDGASGFSIGSREDYPDFNWDGDISEVLVYDRVLGEESLAQAGSYLATRYGLTTKWPERSDSEQPSANTGPSNSEAITELYLAAFSRRPAQTELVAMVSHIERSPSRRQGLEDVYWAVLNSKEFVFQH